MIEIAFVFVYKLLNLKFFIINIKQENLLELKKWHLQ